MKKRNWISIGAFLGIAAAPLWPYSKSITLNTTATGAAVTADVPNYPMAVQLNAQNFDFAQAQADGADLRFTDEAGKPLPFEIESWDKDGKTAVAWVLTDVKGNSSSQKIMMLWGNAALAGASDGKAVFSDAAGFLGAYHLNQDGGTAAGGFKDASWFEAHGTGVLMPATSSTPALIGKGTVLSNPAGGASGKLQWVKVEGEKILTEFGTEKHPITASVWLNAKSWGGYYETILSRDDAEYTLQRDWQGETEVCISMPKDHECVLISMKPPTNTWTHYMIMRKSGSPALLALFVNGKKMSQSTLDGVHKVQIFGIGNNSRNGGATSKRGVDGTFDECRVMKVEKNEMWAKLEYESQKPGAKFLAFGETSTGIGDARLLHPALAPTFGGIHDLLGRWLDLSRRAAPAAPDLHIRRDGR